MTLIRKMDEYPSVLSMFNDLYDTYNFNRVSKDSSLPLVNIKENDNGFVIELVAPGMNKEDFKVEIDNKLLTIAFEKSEEKKEDNQHYCRREFSNESFRRTFTLSESIDIDKIDGKYEKGILFVNVPKKTEAMPKPIRTIAVG